MSAQSTSRRVPIWHDGVKFAFGVLVPCAAFVCLIALSVSGMPNKPPDPEEIQRSLSDEKWMQLYEDRLEATSRGGRGDR
jgi:hypothetical protein